MIQVNYDECCSLLLCMVRNFQILSKNMKNKKKTPSIQVSGYMGLHTWILILSNYPMFGYMDSWISQFVMYPDTWIHGYLDIMDTWIVGYFNFFSIWIMDSQNSLDIQVSRYHIPTVHTHQISPS